MFKKINKENNENEELDFVESQEKIAKTIEELPRYVSPSTDPVDRSSLVSYAQEMLDCGADFLHCDVMDGVAVSRTTINEKDIYQVRKKVPKMKLDIHLMTVGNCATVKKYVRLKPYAVTVQYEFFDYEKELIKVLKTISSSKAKCGISISPSTPISYVTPYLKFLDIILIMGVEPGASGQKLIPGTINKVKEVKNIKNKLKSSLIIAFDGGVNYSNSGELYMAGVDVLVSGSTVYNSFDRAYAIRSLRSGVEPLIK